MYISFVNGITKHPVIHPTQPGHTPRQLQSRSRRPPARLLSIGPSPMGILEKAGKGEGKMREKGKKKKSGC